MAIAPLPLYYNWQRLGRRICNPEGYGPRPFRRTRIRSARMATLQSQPKAITSPVAVHAAPRRQVKQTM